ncbi:unnamed protein product [Fusarium graminearum]|uniref:Chromosome 4, complete genome n=1 Tax=Gibberella zeae (strain ATCC MYA-4620 / CBS 123657 / FGSC 9075 / NRRL 31084 / PH-1) TaxID=229533 RepID=I1S9U8_GIBZE|nr:hypothetical protein FGSG_13629 [Fusarium graminearum PH-1]ESU16323.1 hypothetical protein FGSG_13629 [Fusarium graminearum PH-1]CEF85046.1 unnamed protein product [Fusarium graminearum]CZS74142.1 unnamed protein product [Fusarium graminearum]|eukprot:XP_011327993.1 hypothetical protein FGSG_13629 [Fusarium graminearum PH-1]
MSPNTQSMDPPRADNFCKPPSPRVAQHIPTTMQVRTGYMQKRYRENCPSVSAKKCCPTLDLRLMQAPTPVKDWSHPCLARGEGSTHEAFLGRRSRDRKCYQPQTPQCSTLLLHYGIERRVETWLGPGSCDRQAG